MKKLLITLSVLFLSHFSFAQFNIDSLKTKDSAMYTIVEEWLGTHYKFGGINKNGIDCSAFSMMFYETRYNIELPRIAKAQYSVSTKIKKEDLEIGDLIFFRTKGRSGWHVGIYLLDGYFVHSANKKSGVKISYLYTPYYEKTYLSGGRI